MSLRRKLAIDYATFLVHRKTRYQSWVSVALCNLRFDPLLEDRKVLKRGLLDDSIYVIGQQAHKKGIKNSVHAFKVYFIEV